jgi:uncharacterized protein
MTGLSQDLPGSHVFVRATGPSGIRIDDRFYKTAIILAPNTVVDDWRPQSVADLEDQDFAGLLDLEPEIALLGTGAKQHLLRPEQLAGFYRCGVGVEVMTTEAACRTFNVLVMDGRKVVAGLLPLDAA